MTTTVNFVGIGSTTNTNTRVEPIKPTNSQQSGAGFGLRAVWAIDAYLWLVLGISIVLFVAEKFFGVMSGFGLLLGDSPSFWLGMALLWGGAMLLMPTSHAGERLAKLMAPVRVTRPEWLHRSKRATREATAPQPEWKVRTAPRPTGRTGSASQRVMEMEL